MFKILALSVLIIAVVSKSFLTQTVAKPLATGVAAPDFTLLDQNALKVTLSDSKNKSPVVLVFYRGYW